MQNMVQLIQLNTIRGLGGLLRQKIHLMEMTTGTALLKTACKHIIFIMTDGLKVMHIQEDWGKKIEDEDWK
jgi:hypothetical protein